MSSFFKKKQFPGKRVLYGFSLWAILFISKLVMLAIIDVLFGDYIFFIGAYHGTVTFILVLISMIVAEKALVAVYKKIK